MSGSYTALAPSAKLRALAGCRLRDTSGSVAVMAAVLAVPLLAVVGIGVDLGRAYRIGSITQNTLDSAVLAAGRAAQTNTTNMAAAAQTAATSYFNAAKPKDVVSSSIALTIDSSGTSFTLTATSWVSTPFLSILSRVFKGGAPSGAPGGCTKSFECLKISRSATSGLAQGGSGGSNVEVSLMLDTTTSMFFFGKIQALQKAASDLVDTVIWTDQSRYTSRMAIVPFSEGVNVGAYYTAVTGKSTKRGMLTVSPCVTDRVGAYAATDAAPSAFSMIPATYDVTRGIWCNEASAIVPLTSDKATLKSAIMGLTASGLTAGALGTQWAWYMISPNWASVWGTASAPGSYADLKAVNASGAAKLKKFAVLMTDGDYNWFSDKLAMADHVNAAALSVCSAMKTAGIAIFTVGFELTSAIEKDLLTRCASSTDKFYDAGSEAALLAAFKDIALKISSLRLTN